MAIGLLTFGVALIVGGPAMLMLGLWFWVTAVMVIVPLILAGMLAIICGLKISQRALTSLRFK